MKKYRVISDRIVGSYGKMHFKGQEVDESAFNAASAERLLAAGRILEIKDYSIPADRKVKLAIVTSVWGRPDIFRKFCVGVKELVKNCPGFEISMALSTSLQEEMEAKHSLELSILWLKQFFKDTGCIHVEVPNKPLAAKVNATTYAAQFLEADYVLCLGSDDILSPELLNHYETIMRRGVDFIGVTDFYFYDTVSNKSLYWGGYREPHRKGHTAGAARALSARLLDAWDWMPWENKDSLVLDKSMQDKLKVTPHTIETFSMKEKGFSAVDIKSSTNMTPFAKWDNSEFIDSKILTEKFPFLCAE